MILGLGASFPNTLDPVLAFLPGNDERPPAAIMLSDEYDREPPHLALVTEDEIFAALIYETMDVYLSSTCLTIPKHVFGNPKSRLCIIESTALTNVKFCHSAPLKLHVVNL